jgi:hypothetical protein
MRHDGLAAVLLLAALKAEFGRMTPRTLTRVSTASYKTQVQLSSKSHKLANTLIAYRTLIDMKPSEEDVTNFLAFAPDAGEGKAFMFLEVKCHRAKNCCRPR